MTANTLAAASLLTCLLAGVDSGAAPKANTYSRRDAQWSETVNGLQARIVLKRSKVSNGTPIIATYLKLRNVSDVMNPLTIPWDGKLMKFRVVDAKGNEVPKSQNFSYDGFMLEGTVDLVLPVRGELSFDYSSHGVGIPGDMAALIDLGVEAIWMMERNQGDCFLHAVLEVPGTGPLRGGEHWHGRIELPPVKIPVGTEPMNKATIEKRIKELGPKMLDKNGRISEEAERAMSLIDDPGVIPWYVKVLETNSYHMKFCALDRLSRFDSDEALGALKKGLATKASDFGETANVNVAPGLVHNIRVCAAQGLARSPHRDAKPLLFSLWNDRDPSVRLDVLHVLGKMDTHESLELLKKMSDDQDEMVRNEAKRYLKLRENGE